MSGDTVDTNADQPMAMPTMGLVRAIPPREPTNGALKEKIPPSDETIQ
jgi:hypothetical protein